MEKREKVGGNLWQDGVCVLIAVQGAGGGRWKGLLCAGQPVALVTTNTLLSVLCALAVCPHRMMCVLRFPQVCRSLS